MTTLNSKRLIINRLFKEKHSKQSEIKNSKNVASWPTQDSFCASKAYENQFLTPISFAFESSTHSNQTKPTGDNEETAKYFNNFNVNTNVGYRPVSGPVIHHPLKRNLLPQLAELERQERIALQKNAKKTPQKSENSKKIQHIILPEQASLKFSSKRSSLQKNQRKKLIPTTLNLHQNSISSSLKVIHPSIQSFASTTENYHDLINREYFTKVPRTKREGLFNKNDPKEKRQIKSIEYQPVKLEHCKKGEVLETERPIRALRQISTKSHDNLHSRNAGAIYNIHDDPNYGVSKKLPQNKLKNFHIKSSCAIQAYNEKKNTQTTNYLLKSFEQNFKQIHSNKENIPPANLSFRRNQKSEDRLKNIRLQLHKIYSNRMTRKDIRQTKSTIENIEEGNPFGKIKKNKSVLESKKESVEYKGGKMDRRIR